MKMRIIAASVMIFAIAAASVGIVNAQVTNEEQKVERSRIERKIRSEILSLPYYGVFDAIGYELNGSTVTLNGYVTRPYTKDDAAEEIRDIAGVTNVINNIEVLPPSPSDDRIRVAAYRAIANHGNMYRYLLGANPSLRIVVNRGRVILEGVVTYESDKTLAEAAVSEVFGVLGITNNLRLERREGEEVS